jgi:ribosomal protein S18 acetylase RimI-like enzyme
MSAGTPAIRPAAVDDAPRIAALHIRAWQWAYRGQLPDAFLDELSSALIRRERQWVQWLSGPGESFTLVAERAGAIVGFVHAGPAREADLPPRTAEVYSIYLDQEAVGQGIGGRLMAGALASMTERGYESAVLWVLESNHRARGFYEKAGWTGDGKRQPLALGATTVQEVRYRKQLARRAARGDGGR